MGIPNRKRDAQESTSLADPEIKTDKETLHSIAWIPPLLLFYFPYTFKNFFRIAYVCFVGCSFSVTYKL